MSRTSRERYAHLRQSFWRHPRITSVGKAARWVYAAGLSYCADAESDGFIPERTAVLMLAEGAKRDVIELVSAGLWATVDGGYQVAGYLAHNKSKAEMQASREAMSKGGKRGGGSNRLAKATRSEQPEQQGTLQPTLQGPEQGSSKVRATEEEEEEEELEKPPLPPPVGVGEDDEDEAPRTLSERVQRQLDLTPTPGSVWVLLEMISALHCRASGRAYAEPGVVCSAADRKLLASVIASAERVGPNGTDVMRIIADEWISLLALVASGDAPPLKNVLAYFAKCFGSLSETRSDAGAPYPPARTLEAVA